MRHLTDAGLVTAALVAYYCGLASGPDALFITDAVCEITLVQRLLGRKAS